MCQHLPLLPWQLSLLLQNSLGVCWSHHCFCVSHHHYSLVLAPQSSSPRRGGEAADGLFKRAWARLELWDGAWRRDSRNFWGIVFIMISLLWEESPLSLSLQSCPSSHPSCIPSALSGFLMCPPRALPGCPICFGSPSLHFCSTHTGTFSSQCCLLTPLGDFRVTRRGEHDKAVTGAAKKAFVQSC